MKKIFETLVILLVVFCVQYASACTQTKESMTGAACSIKELNSLETNKIMQKRANFSFYEEKDLRPVKVVPVMQNLYNDDCLFGMCFYRQILDNKSK